MEFIVLVIIIIAAAGGYLVWKSRSSTMAKGGEEVRPKTVANLDPGDGVAFWDGQNLVVDAVLDCTEQVGSRSTSWQWVVMNDGRLLEMADDGKTAFGPPLLLHQGSAPFEQLTGNQGVLKTFEHRVREGVAGSQPVHFLQDGTNYQVKSTGIFTAAARGQVQEREVLRDISPTAGDNVYFEMESGDGQVGLGIWTTHIALYTGHALQESDIVDIFPKAKEANP